MRSTQQELSLQRQELLEDLNAKASLLKLSITIVFDGQMEESCRGFYGDIEFLFSATGETADQLILSLVENKSKDVTVVTSDLQLATLVRSHSAKTISVEHFIRWLNKRYTSTVKKPQKLKKIASVSGPSAIKLKPKKTSHDHSSDGHFEYYLKHFEQQYENMQKEEKPKRKKRGPKKTDSLEDKLDDYTRWLTVFEKRAQEPLEE